MEMERNDDKGYNRGHKFVVSRISNYPMTNNA